MFKLLYLLSVFGFIYCAVTTTDEKFGTSEDTDDLKTDSTFFKAWGWGYPYPYYYTPKIIKIKVPVAVHAVEAVETEPVTVNVDTAPVIKVKAQVVSEPVAVAEDEPTINVKVVAPVAAKAYYPGFYFGGWKWFG